MTGNSIPLLVNKVGKYD